ncbi:transcription elongation factor GreAB [Chitinophaga sp. SYP-B3965]|uniref:GreA/GreB family elongation factor n=1 Tax=Chitinophaga sp. SYP-B3965 TaxID=2663120 RepID=UPI001299D9F2|nr:GreA/GreB family elongation factor [Chitinophaga sp. SYP-B3965]MRG44943.1 transcription elongation factor GreAB [Chitinophaga sp. SYP-B3965]
MQKVKHQLVFREDDYEMLTACLNDAQRESAFGPQEVATLKADFKRGKLVSREDFPEDVVALNSRVKVKDTGNDKVMELVVVMPEEADIKQRKISVMGPVGVALIGFREGQEVMWQVPAGKKVFTILKVENQ